ncbi:MAG: EF-hand domain-containing protein [Hyphomicrobiaceae bacterium]
MRFKAFSLAAIAMAIALPAHAENMGSKEAAALGGNVFKKLDKNHDGKLDANEFQALVKHHFNKADKNHDGVVDQDEMGGAEANALIQMKEF